jgi:crotonobetainyl-CoA:carnitine CoA-transferase CaiB-like acyl-CoA transferase
MHDALKGIAVLEVGTMTPGKFAGFLMVGWGASSLRIERPDAGGGPTISDEDLTLNHGKRSIALNLKAREGRDILLRLAAQADVFMESYRPGVAARLGIDDAVVRGANPRIVYCSLSGFGQTGPDRLRPAYDLNILAETGFSTLMAGPHAPAAPGTYLADSVSGLMAAFAIAAALRRREATGQGGNIDLSMQESLFSLLAVSHGTMRSDGDAPAFGGMAGYDIFEAADGRFIALGVARGASCETLFAHLGRPDLAADGMKRGADGAAASTFLREALAQKPAADWLAELAPLDIEIAPVNTPGEAFANSQLAARSMILETAHPTAGPLRQIGLPAADAHALTPAPAIGVDAESVLRDLGYDDDGIAGLRGTGVI